MVRDALNRAGLLGWHIPAQLGFPSRSAFGQSGVFLAERGLSGG